MSSFPWLPKAPPTVLLKRQPDQDRKWLLRLCSPPYLAQAHDLPHPSMTKKVQMWAGKYMHPESKDLDRTLVEGMKPDLAVPVWLPWGFEDHIRCTWVRPFPRTKTLREIPVMVWGAFKRKPNARDREGQPRERMLHALTVTATISSTWWWQQLASRRGSALQTLPFCHKRRSLFLSKMQWNFSVRHGDLHLPIYRSLGVAPITDATRFHTKDETQQIRDLKSGYL